VSSKAIYTQAKALRGGIPICWPQFGPGALIQHGFARTSQWTLGKSVIAPDGSTASAILVLKDNEDTRKLWNDNRFTLEYTIELDASNSLTATLKVVNENASNSFEFTTALHTYFLINDIKSVHLIGLKGLDYIDKTQNAAKFKENNESVSFSGETDRVYINAPDEIIIKDTSVNSQVSVKKQGFKDAVAWNPWEVKCGTIADMGKDDWIKMVWVEAGNVSTPVTLTPKQEWSGSINISAKL